MGILTIYKTLFVLVITTVLFAGCALNANIYTLNTELDKLKDLPEEVTPAPAPTVPPTDTAPSYECVGGGQQYLVLI